MPPAISVIDLVFATDRCHQLDDPWQDRAIAVRFHDLERRSRAVLDVRTTQPVDGVIAVGDRPVVTGGARRRSARASVAYRRRRARQLATSASRVRVLAAAGLPSPRFHVHVALVVRDARCAVGGDGGLSVRAQAGGAVGSRGVIRADIASRNSRPRFERIRALLARPGDSRRARRSRRRDPGRGVHRRPRVRDRRGADATARYASSRSSTSPIRSTGPFFEETIYVTPSRLERDVAGAIVDRRSRRAAAALGLRHGPLHAECRVTPTARSTCWKSPRGRSAGSARACWHSRIARRDVGRRRSSECCSSTPSGDSIDGWTREAAAAARDDDPDPVARDCTSGVAGEEAARAMPGDHGRHDHRETRSAARAAAGSGQLPGVHFCEGADAQPDAEAPCGRRTRADVRRSSRRSPCGRHDAHA